METSPNKKTVRSFNNRFININLDFDIKEAKNKYHSNLFDKCSGNSSQELKLINNLTDNRDK